jgi:hypothetical protein
MVTVERKGNVKYTTVGNYTKYCIDSLNLRKHVNKQKVLIAGLNNVTRAKHIHGLDAYDKSRQLSAINKIQLNPKKQRANYIQIGDSKMLLNKYIKQLKATRTPFIVDLKINKKLYVNGEVYDIINTIA